VTPGGAKEPRSTGAAVLSAKFFPVIQAFSDLTLESAFQRVIELFALDPVRKIVLA
jgi:hypothetical protein